MSAGASRRPARGWMVLLSCACVLAALAGCRSLSGVAGGVAGAASGTASGNAGVGIAVAIGVRAAFDEALNALLRYWSREEQEHIAQQVGAMAPGERRRWALRQLRPNGNREGDVTVVRAFETPLAPCKEAVITPGADAAADAATDAAAPRQHFVITVCRGDSGSWQWAVAEPSVQRWGALQ